MHEECNDVRVKNAERTIAPGTLRNAILEWNAQNIGTSSALEALIQGFYAKTNSLPTLEQCNDICIQNGQRIIAPSSFSKAISKWNREHSNAKTVGALIHELHAEMDCLPTTPSTYAKEIKKWNRQHASSQSEHAESMSSIGNEESDDIVSAEVEKWINDLTHSGAERGIRKEGHIKPINDAVKERVQRDIDEYLESNSRKMSTCACCDELCRPMDTHDVSLNKRWTDILCKRLHWTSNIPDAIRADNDVSKVDSRLQALRNVALFPRGILEGKHGGNSQLRFCKSCFTSLNNTQLNTPQETQM